MYPNRINLRPIVSNLNLPTVIKTAILPGEFFERIFIATQIGEIFFVGNSGLSTFLDIHPYVLKLGAISGGYDERGLLGLAFHPDFHDNGLFYLHYTIAGSQGPGALKGPFTPNPCDPDTLSLQWTNRDTLYDHIDTVEEWILQSSGGAVRRRVLLNIRRPFLNHNGVNSLNFSPETGRLVLTTGDGGSGYDPFNLAQNIMEIAGKIIEIDVNMDASISNFPIITRFNELPPSVLNTFHVIAKGVRNIPGITYQSVYQQYLKYVGIVGQDLVESIYSFLQYQPIPVTEIVQASSVRNEPNQEALINFGWRGWEGNLPTTILRSCSKAQGSDEKITAYYEEAIQTSSLRLQPLTCYYHEDLRPDKFGGTALTGVQVYLGNDIPELAGSVVFTDLARDEDSPPPVRGALAYTRVRADGKPNDYSLLEADYDFGTKSAYYVSLGANLDQTRLFLGVYGSMKVADNNLGTVFEIIPI